MRQWIHCLLLLVALPAVTFANGMRTLSDAELSEVSGREGVVISFDYYLNSEKSNDKATDGQILGTYCGASNLNCRFTWQIAGRGDGEQGSYAGEWLVYKDGYASLSVNELSLDAAFLGEAGMPAWVDDAFVAGNTRFQDVDGNCLLEGGCTVANMMLTPALRTHYSNTGGNYNPLDGTTTGYSDVLLGMHIGGLAVEYDAGAVPGYNRNEQGSFMGLSIRDNNGPRAGIAFGGDFYMYGF